MLTTIKALITNTTMKKYTTDEGKELSIWITPKKGYELHDKNYDTPVIDEATGIETGEITEGFRISTATVSIDYDFDKNPREFYARKTEES